MLSDAELERWYCSLGLSQEARALIDKIRNSQPVRAVQGFRSVHGRYPSRKMGVTIQFESHKNELAFIKEYEHDEDVLEYYDQPSIIKLNYESINGRRLGVLHTPDIFALRTFTAGWEECKLEEQLVKLLAKAPHRYSLDAEGNWRCIPGEEYAKPYGLYYHLRSSKEINWAFQRSVEFLEDYFRNDSPMVAEDARDSLIRLVAAEPGITLEDLFRLIGKSASRDDVFTLIAKGELYVDLHKVPLTETDRVQVFPDNDTALAYENLVRTTVQSGVAIPRYVDLTTISFIQLDNNWWKIAYVSEKAIGLVGEGQSFTELPINAFEKLVRENRITSTKADSSSDTHQEVKRRLAEADKRAYAEANRRSGIVRAYMSGEPLPLKPPISERTVRYWVAQYRFAQEAYGSGYIGLLPKRRGGNTKGKLPPTTRALIDEFIENDYETLKHKGKFEVYSSFKRACEQRGILPSSYKTFCRNVKRRSRYKQTLKRQGPKAAYKDKEFYRELTPTTPRHGERPLHIAHIDHTELDIELVCSITGKNLGRPWATFLTDAYSRRLAVYLTYDPPSYRSCMMIFRECVQRFSRLPQIIVVDGGREFSGIYFETLLARYECTKKTRPPAESRFGSVCERLFGTTNTRFIHNLQGNTQLMRNVRQVTKSINPKENAIWTLGKLYQYLREWAYEVYDTIEHPALGQSPREAFAKGTVYAGERSHRLIPYNEEFRLLTLPTTPRMTAKVYPDRGVKINYIYYWSEAFRHPEVEGVRVHVRFDPFNIGRSFVYVRGQWHECYSEYYKTFLNRSERELMLATAELKRRQTRHSGQTNITAAKLAEFLESVEAEEILLRQQTTDREVRGVLTMVDSRFYSLPDVTSHATSFSSNAANKLQPSKPSSSDGSSKVIDLEVYGEF